MAQFCPFRRFCEAGLPLFIIGGIGHHGFFKRGFWVAMADDRPFREWHLEQLADQNGRNESTRRCWGQRFPEVSRAVMLAAISFRILRAAGG
jgi:hypothetical protein